MIIFKQKVQVKRSDVPRFAVILSSLSIQENPRVTDFWLQVYLTNGEENLRPESLKKTSFKVPVHFQGKIILSYRVTISGVITLVLMQGKFKQEHNFQWQNTDWSSLQTFPFERNTGYPPENTCLSTHTIVVGLKQQTYLMTRQYWTQYQAPLAEHFRQ